ncbi:MAG: DUF3307 domain-containing protein [Elusimicrobia bacterium]|nr:DUF3307 domain-containing protein [Elusimicrobiota bacterium]MBD3412684.1 DUF3307 domain-containing protein [Elusimicrobiota bacterium]
MKIFWCLIFSHFLADFTFQTNYIAQWKDKNIWGRWAHVFIFMAVSLVMTFPALGELWVNYGFIRLNGWASLVILTMLHLAEDQFRIWCVHKRKLNDNTLFFLYDQTVHIGLIIVFTPWSKNMALFDTVWMQLGTLFVLNTHFATILIYYLEKDFFREHSMVVATKYFAIAERIIIASLFILPGWWWTGLIALWIGYWSMKKIRGLNDRTWFDLVLSYGIAGLTGYAARIILFP